MWRIRREKNAVLFLGSCYFYIICVGNFILYKKNAMQTQNKRPLHDHNERVTLRKPNKKVCTNGTRPGVASTRNGGYSRATTKKDAPKVTMEPHAEKKPHRMGSHPIIKKLSEDPIKTTKSGLSILKAERELESNLSSYAVLSEGDNYPYKN
jgi:hypothetical protein